jgi:hypothetical protein
LARLRVEGERPHRGRSHIEAYNEAIRPGNRA